MRLLSIPAALVLLSTIAGATAAQAQVVNDCTRAIATDRTGMASVTLTFANGNFTYAPKCLLVDVGTEVRFLGNFPSHPLAGGSVFEGAATPATSGPFLKYIDTGNSRTFVMDQAGTWPYYCGVHGEGASMYGVVYVGPVDEVFASGFE